MLMTLVYKRWHFKGGEMDYSTNDFGTTGEPLRKK